MCDSGEFFSLAISIKEKKKASKMYKMHSLNLKKNNVKKAKWCAK